VSVGAALVFVAALVVPARGPGSAQTVAEPAEVVSQTAGGLPWPDDNRESSISADGRFVEFDSFPEVREVVARDRVGNTTGTVPLIPSLTGSISDNGCVIAYTYGVATNVGSGSIYSVFGFDRCAGLNLAVGTAFVQGGAFAPEPKPNQDGSVIVWSTPTSIERSVRSGNTYTQGEPITFPRLQSVFGPRLAVSDDGNVVAFETISTAIGVVDFRAPADIQAISVDDKGGTLTGATDPSISGDGTLVTYSLLSNDVRMVMLRDRPNALNRLIAAPATSAEISRDGKYITFLLRIGEIGETYVARSTSTQPFATFELDLVSYRAGDPATGTGGSTSNPAISEHGRWVSFDSYAASALVPGQGFDDTGTHVYVRQRRPIVTVDSIDFGTVGGPTDRQATVRSVGLAGFVITSIDASGDFSVVGHNCPAVLQPGASCVISVRFGASGTGQKTGVLSVHDDSYPGVPLVGSGRLVGVLDRQIPPPPPPGRAGLVISPNPVLFDDTEVGVAAPSVIATVGNIGNVSITIDGVSLSGAAASDFSVISDGCTGVSLAASASCDLELGFTASQSGPRIAAITASGSGSTSATAELVGKGRVNAMLMVTPEVAAGGQVVTVVGSDYPPSTTVSITLGADPPTPVTTDAEGGFMLPWLILSGTPQGELLADDVPVVGVYDAEPAPLLVVGSPVRPQATATLSRSGRQYVSR